MKWVLEASMHRRLPFLASGDEGTRIIAQSARWLFLFMSEG